jgi:hypothetical protein
VSEVTSNVAAGLEVKPALFVEVTLCVPLVVAVGSRRQTVWFGVGRRCR